MTARDEHWKHCWPCRFEGDPIRNDEILDEFKAKVLGDVVGELEGIKKEPSKIYESHYKDGEWKSRVLDNPLAYQWNAALDEAIKRIKSL